MYMLDWLGLISVAWLALFPIVDPFGAAPFFLAITSGDTPAHRNRQLLKGCIVAFLILVVFLVGGNLIITFFGISIPGIRIAGGILLARLAIEMLHTEPETHKHSQDEVRESAAKTDVSITPLAIPVLSGPGSIAATLSLTSLLRSWVDYAAIIIGIALVLFLCWLILQASTRVVKALGVSGIHAMTRMMGFLTLCMGVQFIINGVLGVVTDPQLINTLLQLTSHAS